MLEQIFLKVIDMSLSASLIIVVVFLVRILLKRFPKFISYMLWSVVLFRLLCPVALRFAFSPVPELEPVFYEYRLEKEAVAAGVREEGQAMPEQIIPGQTVPGQVLPEPELSGHMLPAQTSSGAVLSGQISPEQSAAEENRSNAQVSLQALFVLYGKYVWIVGIAIMLLYSVISTFRIRRSVAEAIPFKKNIYLTAEDISPFVMGIFKPRIYLPEGLAEREQEYILQHEKYHIKRMDHIVKPVAFAALSVHWFNPLVWIAFSLFCKDMEMSCDEAVVSKMGEHIRADYAESLFALSTRHRILQWIPVDFGEGDTKGRVRNLAAFRKTKKGVLAILVTGAVLLIACLASTRGVAVSEAYGSGEKNAPTSDAGTSTDGNGDTSGVDSDSVISAQPTVSPDPAKLYHTHVGNPGNLYFIDENHVLWGSGSNNYGQLGQGTQDYEFHSDKVKIAEHVIDVDYSQKGFIIYLTDEHKLYGVGNAGCGALQQYDTFDSDRYVNAEHYCISEPHLLMEHVVLARCGRDDVACLTEDGAVWIWGTVWSHGVFPAINAYFVPKPQKVLEHAVLVTGGWDNHAALLQDGTVWTWGYNIAGNCGVADPVVVSEPAMVAENVVMVWTDRALKNYPEPTAEDIAAAWTGKLTYNTEYDDIADFGGIYPRLLNNTVIQKTDGSYWVCGENVGETTKVVHGAEGEYSVTCTHEFQPCEQNNIQPTYWINRHGEVYDSSFAPAGLDETLNTVLWLSTHEGEIIGENLPGSEYPCIAESEGILEAAAGGEDVWSMQGNASVVWIRIEQEHFVAPEGSIGQVSHKDYIIYREGEDAYVGLQSVEDGNKWTVSRIAGYGEWLERELDIFIRMTTGL